MALVIVGRKQVRLMLIGGDQVEQHGVVALACDYTFGLGVGAVRGVVGIEGGIVSGC